MTEITVDASLDAVMMLCEAAIKGDLGEENLCGMFKQPSPLSTMGGASLPALAVYILSETEERMSSTALNSNLMVMFDYVRTGTHTTELETTYPPLRHVWRSIRNVLNAGAYPTINGGADVMLAAGMDVREGTPEVERYGLMEAEVYPFFRAKMLIEFTPSEVNFADLDDYLTHFTGWTQPGDEEFSPELNDTTNLLGTEKLEGDIAGSSTLDGNISDD